MEELAELPNSQDDVKKTNFFKCEEKEGKEKINKMEKRKREVNKGEEQQ